ncbi:MAG TPA: YciI family protein [Bryobacteraceae bacterium]|nr:YciI family protein [Bryobacteraceae bacterium]
MRFLSIYRCAEKAGPPTQEEIIRMGVLIEEQMKSGHLLAVEGCFPSVLGARVRLTGGRLAVTDGPFTESKEIIGGFALLQASSKEEAIQLVKRFLEVVGGEGECELRQVCEGRAV